MLKHLDLMADIIRQRATLKTASFDHLMQADGFLFLSSLLNEACDRPWYPHTLIFAGYRRTFEMFARAASKAEFGRLASVLGTASKEELLSKYASAVKRHAIERWSSFTFHAHVDFKHLFGFEKLDTIP
mgnify:FL=1